jgi:dihydrofolate reductase
MAKVILSVFTSLDGFYAGPNGEFIPPEWSADMGAWADQAMEQSGHLIYGRVNFEFNKAHWSAETSDFASGMNAKPKTVFSRTLKGDPGWNAVVSDDPAARVAELKASVDRDIFIFGSGNLVKSFVALDLIDEYRILLTPFVQGSGMRLFADGAPNLPLTLVEARGFDTGAVLLRHQRKRES